MRPRTGSFSRRNIRCTVLTIQSTTGLDLFWTNSGHRQKIDREIEYFAMKLNELASGWSENGCNEQGCAPEETMRRTDCLLPLDARISFLSRDFSC
jgi:hypothetical protein